MARYPRGRGRGRLSRGHRGRHHGRLRTTDRPPRGVPRTACRRRRRSQRRWTRSRHPTWYACRRAGRARGRRPRSRQHRGYFRPSRLPSASPRLCRSIPRGRRSPSRLRTAPDVIVEDDREGSRRRGPRRIRRRRDSRRSRVHSGRERREDRPSGTRLHVECFSYQRDITYSRYYLLRCNALDLHHQQNPRHVLSSPITATSRTAIDRRSKS